MTEAEPAHGSLWLRALSSVVEVSGDVPARLRLDLRDLTVPPAPASTVLEVHIRHAGDRWSLQAGAGLEVDELSYDDMADHLVGLLNRTALDGEPDRLHLHAACVERDGLGLLLVGASESGKTTLTAGLVERGWSYLTDEMVPVALGDRTISAYPKPLTLKGWAIGRFAEEDRRGQAGPATRVVLPASALGKVSSYAEAGVVVFPRFVEGSSTHLAEVPPMDAVHELMATTFDAGRFGADSLWTLVELVARTTCWQLRFGDLASAVDAIADLPPRRAPLPWRAAHGGPVGIAVAELDGGRLELDLAASALRTQPSGGEDAPSLVHAAVPTRPEVSWAASATVARGQRLLAAAGIPAAATPSGGLIVAAHDRRRAHEALERAVIAVDIAEGPGLPDHAEEVIAAAIPVRMGGEWCQGIGPAHRLLDACVGRPAGDEREGLVGEALKTSVHVLEQFWEIAVRWEVVDEVATTLVDHAARTGRLPDLLDRRVRQLPGTYFLRYPPVAPVAGKVAATELLPLLITGSPWRDQVLADLTAIEDAVGPGRTMWRLILRDGTWSIQHMWPRALFPPDGFEGALEALAPVVGLEAGRIRELGTRSVAVRFTVACHRRIAEGRLEDFQFVSGMQFEGTNALCSYRWDGGGFRLDEVTSDLQRAEDGDVLHHLSTSFHHQQPFEMPKWATEHHAVIVSRQGERDLLYVLGLDITGLLDYLAWASWPAEVVDAMGAAADKLDHLRFDVAYDASSLGPGRETSVLGGTRPAPFNG